MKTLERRSFLSLISSAFVGSAICPFSSLAQPDNQGVKDSCWLDVCAPFIVQDSTLGIESEIVLTSDNFIGATGYADGADATEYEIYLYDFAGHPIGEHGVAKRLVAPAMRTTVISVNELVGPGKSFWGGLKIRLRPKTRFPTHASDLFSSAFVRWKTKESFANVHANPDPIQWQRPDPFFYSMPFPPLRDYECVYSLFNPYLERSAGVVTLYDPFGTKLKELPYDLGSYSSSLIDLRKGDYITDVKESLSGPSAHAKEGLAGGERGGTIAVTNKKGSVKNFGYLLIKQAQGSRFSIEHPIHQQPFTPKPAPLPFDSLGRLKARNVLYTPLVFNQKKIGGITLDSRFHLSSGAPLEEHLWLSPFVTDGSGAVAWRMSSDTPPPKAIPAKQIERDVIKLGGQQSCILDASQLSLPQGFSGGLSLAITPLSNHTLMKVELRAAEWGAQTFTHFRPGLAAARAYQRPKHRAGLATDYIGSGARIQSRGGKPLFDEIVAVINIDDKNITGNPSLEIFGSGGLVTRVPLGSVPAFSCRHYLLSDLLSGKIAANDLSLRLVDEQATLLMSLVHLDYERRDFAADHGSDRFSTFSEFTCDPQA